MIFFFVVIIALQRRHIYRYSKLILPTSIFHHYENHRFLIQNQTATATLCNCSLQGLQVRSREKIVYIIWLRRCDYKIWCVLVLFSFLSTELYFYILTFKCRFVPSNVKIRAHCIYPKFLGRIM